MVSEHGEPRSRNKRVRHETEPEEIKKEVEERNEILSLQSKPKFYAKPSE